MTTTKQLEQEILSFAYIQFDSYAAPVREAVAMAMIAKLRCLPQDWYGTLWDLCFLAVPDANWAELPTTNQLQA